MTAVERDSAAVIAAAGAAPFLAVRELTIRHPGARGSTPAGLSFDVAPGEVVLVLGPSGSGKSTLTLALNGLIPHDVPADVTGTIRVDGLEASVTPVAVLSTRVGMVFQDPDTQLVTGSVLDEVAFGPENLRMPVDDVLRRSERALRRMGLWDRRFENPDRLSGGQRQRLAIAAALALGSPLLVLDEPTANLDPQGIEEVYAALAELVADGDRAIVLVEHNLDAAVELVDRVVALDGDGRLVADGPIDTVLRTRAEELHALGVWLPTATLAALRLRRVGFGLDPLPLTPAELRAALEAQDPPAASTGTAGRVDGAGGPPVAQRVPFVSSRSRSLSEPGGRDEATAAPLITVRDLSLRRGRTQVLHDIDLDIARGEFVAVVGANGAGKTSLVQAIAGVIPAPRAKVRIDGLDPGTGAGSRRGSRSSTRSQTARRGERGLAQHVGFVFQNPEHQFVAHTVHDELAHSVRHLPEAEARERIGHMLDLFGLSARADRHPFLLSGGEKRRLSVGTALIAGASVLALDEPTFGQDRARADELLALLRSLNDQATTILVVTHDMQLVTEYATSTVVMADGRVIAHGATADVFADEALITRAGLRLPPLQQALRGMPRHPSLTGVTRLSDLPTSLTA